MGVLGGQLKMREKITGRFADILANMYMATAILRRFEAEGRRDEDLPFVHYSVEKLHGRNPKRFRWHLRQLKNSRHALVLQRLDRSVVAH